MSVYGHLKIPRANGQQMQLDSSEGMVCSQKFVVGQPNEFHLQFKFRNTDGGSRDTIASPIGIGEKKFGSPKMESTTHATLDHELRDATFGHRCKRFSEKKHFSTRT